MMITLFLLGINLVVIITGLALALILAAIWLVKRSREKRAMYSIEKSDMKVKMSAVESKSAIEHSSSELETATKSESAIGHSVIEAESAVENSIEALSSRLSELDGCARLSDSSFDQCSASFDEDEAKVKKERNSLKQSYKSATPKGKAKKSAAPKGKAKKSAFDENRHVLHSASERVESHMSEAWITSSVPQSSGLIGSYYGQGRIPLTNKLKPLPHDGLFIRRNNAFGRKATMGIKDLIENGVLIDQTNIRFDDFLASNDHGIPAPGPDQAIAVSQGVSEARSQYQHHPDTTHYLEIAIKASNVSQSVRPTGVTVVNYVFVIDTSGSMSGEKLDIVKASIRKLYQRMRADDVIGLIEFNTKVKTLLKATPKEKITDDEFSNLISNLRANGGTDLNLGLSYGIDEISRHEKPDIINNIYLFSDGNPTSGEIDWVKIRQNIAAKVARKIGVSIFAFGSDANIKELDALSGITGGKFAFVAHPEDVHLNLQEDIQRREYLAAINIQIKIEIDQDIQILHLYGHDEIADPVARAAVLKDVEAAKLTARKQLGVEAQPDIVTEEKGIRIFAPDLAIGETYWVVFELSVPAGRKDTNLGKATIQYADTFKRSNERLEIQIPLAGTLPPDVVLHHALELWTSEVAFYALDDLYQDDLETARARIDRHIQMLEYAKADLSSPRFTDDIISLRKFVSLAQNLGKSMSYTEDLMSGARGYTVYALNRFGQARSGFVRGDYF